MQIDGKIGVNVLLRAVVIFVAVSPVGAWAQDANSRTVEQYSCKDVMREHGNNRDVTIAFLQVCWENQAARHSISRDLHKQTSAFIEYCLDNPGERAVDAMAKIKG